MSWAGIFKAAIFVMGGLAGWVVAEFKPAFPLVVVAVIFILYDAWTAYKLDKRAHAAYPKRTARHEAKFTSFAFGKVVKQTIPKRLWGRYPLTSRCTSSQARLWRL